MAKRKKEEVNEESPSKALLARIRDRYKKMEEADSENRREALADMKFVNVPGEQWDARMKTKRGKRPCYEFNKLRITCKRIINDMRANRPAGKVRGTEDSDKDTAEIYEGLIRNIWNRSDGDTVIDYAGEYQVTSGMGAWRIVTKYATEDAFDQDIMVEPFQNPFCLMADPAAKDHLKRDAVDWIVTDKVSKAAYEERWPNKDVVSWEGSEFDDEDDQWSDDDSVRIVEYWYKEPYDKELWQLADGKVIDGGSDEAKLIDPSTIKKKRIAKCHKIKMCIASGEAILEEADWAGSEFPFVLIYGEHMVIDGKVKWFGLPRFAKDAQRGYNVSRTAMIENVAMVPQAKWWATPEQMKGHSDKWEQAVAENIPFLGYNADAKAPGPPIRMGGADVPAALVQLSMLDSEDIKAVTGIFDNSLGQGAGEKSGRAIIARQQQGEIATFNFQDNMAKGIRRTWEILVDLIPKIYDTERELRILGSDGAEKYKKVNQVVFDPATMQTVKVNDLAQGRYDVTITVGPSFSTKRQEASETYLQLAQASPEVMAVAGDLIFKAMDLPYSEDISDRLKAMLPPQIQQMLSEGKQIPPEAQAVMAQAAQAMQIVEQKSQLVQAAAQELQQEQQGIESGKAEIQAAVSDLDAKKAEFQATIAQELAKLQIAQANLKVAEAQLQLHAAQKSGEIDAQQSDASRQNFEAEVQQAVGSIQQMAAQFGTQAAQTLALIQQQTIETSKKPRLSRLETQRVNGKLVATPVYEDSTA